MGQKPYIFALTRDKELFSKFKEISKDRYRLKRISQLDSIPSLKDYQKSILVVDISTYPELNLQELNERESFKILVYDRHTSENIGELLPYYDFYINKLLPPDELKSKFDRIGELLSFNLNRITHLPGNTEFEDYYLKNQSRGLAVAFMDVDNFKYFCAAKGFFRAELLLRLISSIIKKNIFTSTIKGETMAFNVYLDRFAIISNRDEIMRICSFIYEDFARSKSTFFDNNELTRQFFVMQDRTGNIFDIPITTITTAIITRQFKSIIELYKNADDIFKYVKSKGGNLIFSDRRQISAQIPEKGTILISVYDPLKSNYLKISLERMGWKVFVTNDGITTLKLYNRVRPSIIILDEGLPMINYKDIINVLRYELSDNKTIIILLSEIDEIINSQYKFSKINGDLNAERLNQKFIALLSQRSEVNP
jgi:GGDEF domain-containing protein